MVALEQNGLALRNIENKTLEICIKAIKQNGLALQHVPEQYKELCIEIAIENNLHALNRYLYTKNYREKIGNEQSK